MRAMRTVPIYRALHRPNLFAGGERRLALTALLFAVLMVVSNMGSLMTWLIAGVFYVGTMTALRKLAKRDPKFTEVYLRQIRYQHYYPPKRGLDAKPKQSRME